MVNSPDGAPPAVKVFAKLPGAEDKVTYNILHFPDVRNMINSMAAKVLMGQFGPPEAIATNNAVSKTNAWFVVGSRGPSWALR